ncbi:MAG: trehalose-phosphatase [Candidatus Margulisiibacteriota bacterium]
MKNLLLFLDYDGTLTPIVKKPHLAKLSKARQAKLRKISTTPHIRVVVISGRKLADLKKLVGIPGIFYAGNHGFEISGPKTSLVHPKAKAAKPIIAKIKKELTKELKGIKGTLVEDKTLTLSLHYRLVKAAALPKVKKIFSQVTEPYLKSKKIRITEGKKVLEVRPNIDWDKGKAVLWFLEKKFKGKRVFPIFIGDDTTDEDAFIALKDKGSTFRVGRSETTHAKHIIKDVDQVYHLLEFLPLEF